MSNVLVTGGAGYIGSHVVKMLGAEGHNVTVLDNLSKGFKESVVHGELIVGDTGNAELISKIIKSQKIDSVMHFAASTIVPESVSDPLKYYRNNTCNTHNLIECCIKNRVENFIFSSTAAVYGTPIDGECTEQTPTNPINPYGTSKLMSEWMLRDACAAGEMNYTILRYFNVAGSDPEGQIGQSTVGATLLIKVAAEAAVGKREKVFVYGTDYETEDGTGIRDYIHVSDLADAHLRALSYLRDSGESTTLNCGYGHGFSVREVLDMVQDLADRPIAIVDEARREGDPPKLIARAERIIQILGWQPKLDDLRTIVSTSIEWERKLLAQRQ
ncbi:MAG: UDP-glucose 4-epimerase [Gammaproteobacteria bacterium]|jgi:UDP-glucose 4-epimerase